MAYKIGTATDYRDLLDQLVDFLQSKGDIATPVYTGTGNGQLLDLDTLPQAPTETWTVECSDDTKVGVADYGAAIASETPVLHWRFNETTGETAEDATANDIDGKLAAHRFWRVLISDNNGSASFTSIAELELRASAGGADLTGSGIPLYSTQSTTSGNSSSAAGFDNSNATRWRTTNATMPSYLGYDFGIPVDIRQVAITATATSGELTTCPKDFTIQYSDDGAAWTTANTITAQTSWTVSQQRLFNAYSGAVTVPITLGTAGLLSVDTDKAFTFASGAGAGCVASAAVAGVQLTGDAALEMIVKPSSISGTQFLGGIAGGGSGNAFNFLLSLWMVDGYLKIYHEYGANNVQQVTSSYKLAAGRAYHLVLSRDSASKRYQLIVGGIVRHTFDYSFPASDGTSAYFSVGLDPDGLYPFLGVIDEVALYNTQISAATAAAHAKDAMGHETFTVTGSVSGAQANAYVGVPYKNNYIEYLIADGATDFIVGDDWSIGVTAGAMGAQRWTVNRREQDKVFLVGPGLSGTDEIYVSILTYFNATSGYYNWELRGHDGYSATGSETGQPNPSPAVTVPLWQFAITYWFVASGRRFIVVAKVSTTYQAAYAGLFLPFATPIQYPYPMAIGGSAGTATTKYSDGGNNNNQFVNPCDNSLVVRNVDGSYKSFANGYYSVNVSTRDYITHPYGARDALNNGSAYLWWPLIREDPSGVFPIWPITLLDLAIDATGRGVIGELDGCFAVSGFNNAAENLLQADGYDHLVVQNVFRTSVGQYWALRLQ
jgi:hypothetical protein